MFRFHRTNDMYIVFMSTGHVQISSNVLCMVMIVNDAVDPERIE